MADDLGNADLGYRGHQIATPNIDKLATEGVRLEDFYGMPVCTPSRAQLMTGRYRDALRPADAGHLPEPHLWARDRRADAAAGAEGGGLQDADGRQMAPRPRRPEILAAEPRLRLFLRQRRRRGRLFHPRARRHDRLAAQRRLPQGGRLLHRSDRRRRGPPDRPAGRQAAVLPLFRLARLARALSGAGERHRRSTSPSPIRSGGPIRR